MNKSKGYSRHGFTLIEMMVVILIITILMAILWLPLSGAKERAQRVLEMSQMQSLINACEQYQKTFGVSPGYYEDKTVWEHREDFTSNENLVIALLGGGTEVDDPVHPFADPDKIGFGLLVDDALGNPRSRDAFYAPKEGELGIATGTLGDDNQIPELIGLYSRMPLLYFRARVGADLPVTANPVDTIAGNPTSDKDLDPFRYGAFARRINMDYSEATALVVDPEDDPVDQANQSLISDVFYTNVVGAPSNELDHRSKYGNVHLATWFAHRGLTIPTWHNTNGEFKNKTPRGALKGGYALVSAGKDGIYFNYTQAGEDGVDRDADYKIYINPLSDPSKTKPLDWSGLDEFDDTVLVGGKTPD